MKDVTYEGVTFIADACVKMKKSEFVKTHLGIFWSDQDEETRRKMLSEAYDLMMPPNKSKKNS